MKFGTQNPAADVQKAEDNDERKKKLHTNVKITHDLRHKGSKVLENKPRILPKRYRQTKTLEVKFEVKFCPKLLFLIKII